jgi:hypothetical protein
VLLNDKYTVEKGGVYLTGIQALVRLPVDQMRRDRRAGLNTGTFISGYEGSPLGGYDLTLQRNQKLLDEYGIHFCPGVNEDLAATSVMGSQIFEVVGKSKTDGVLGIWYGKGPGVDRSGDIFRHANLAGTGKNCAALVLCGDDHSCKSSTIPHQSDFSLYNFGIPFSLSGQYAGDHRLWIARGRVVAAFGRMGRAQASHRHLRRRRDGGGRPGITNNTPAGGLSENRRRAAGSADYAWPRTRGKRATVAGCAGVRAVEWRESVAGRSR